MKIIKFNISGNTFDRHISILKEKYELMQPIYNITTNKYTDGNLYDITMKIKRHMVNKIK
jgi:hypothetical protein